MICNSTGDYWLVLSPKSRPRRVMTLSNACCSHLECDYCTVLSASLSGLVGRRMSQAGSRQGGLLYCALCRLPTQYSSCPSSTFLHPRFDMYMTRCRHGASTSRRARPIVRAQELESSPCLLDTSECTMTGAAWSLFRHPYQCGMCRCVDMRPLALQACLRYKASSTLSHK